MRLWAVSMNLLLRLPLKIRFKGKAVILTVFIPAIFFTAKLFYFRELLTN